MSETIQIYDTPLRVCRICGLEAHTEEDLGLFTKTKEGKYGRLLLCKKCGRERAKKWREDNLEKARKRDRQYYKDTKEKISKRRKIYYDENKDRLNETRKKNYRENPEKFKDRSNKYREKNIEKIRKKRQDNREHHNEYVREYRRSRPLKTALSKLKGRSKKNQLGFDLDIEYLHDLWDECGGICPMTGVLMRKTSTINDPFSMSVDRIIPEKGYTKGNVRFVSLWYNTARSNWGDFLTREMCQRVVSNLPYGVKINE